MFNNRNSMVGSSLSEYAIIIGILVLVAAPIYIFFGSKISDSFKSYSNDYAAEVKYQQPKTLNPEVIYDSEKIEIESQPELELEQEPSANCLNGFCVIDFGEFELTGVPENFNELVETSGVSGGTKISADLLAQLAEIVKTKGDIESYESIKKLAVLANNIAVIEEAGDAHYLAEDKVNTIMPKPEGYDETYGAYVPDEFTKKDYSLSKNKYYTGEINKEFFDQLEIIRQETTLDPSILGIIEELVWSVDSLATNHVFGFEDPDSNYYGTIEDFQDGYYKWYEEYLDYYSTFDAPQITDYNIMLICGALESEMSCH